MNLLIALTTVRSHCKFCRQFSNELTISSLLKHHCLGAREVIAQFVEKCVCQAPLHTAQLPALYYVSENVLKPVIYQWQRQREHIGVPSMGGSVVMMWVLPLESIYTGRRLRASLNMVQLPAVIYTLQYDCTCDALAYRLKRRYSRSRFT